MDSWTDFNRRTNLGRWRAFVRSIAILYRLYTVKRALNYVTNLVEYRRRKIRLRSFPPKAIFDLASVCNLRCPLCATGAGILKQRQMFMSFELFSRTFPQMADRVLFVNLYNWGESFLNPDIFSIIDEVHASGALSHVHSNLNLKPGIVDQIAESNLTTLVLSVDGARDETYEAYRQKGDFQLVLGNMRRLMKRRRELGKRFPEVIWKYIVHKKNEDDIDAALELAKDVGVDKLQLTPIWADLQPGAPDPRQDEWAAEWIPVKRTEFAFETRKNPLFEQTCPFLWKDPVINADGSVAPCCFVKDAKHNFGDLNTHTFEEIWNNDLYRYSRSLFTTEEYDGPPVQSVCDQCTLYRQIDQPKLPMPTPEVESA
jgi:radical SAM protein with 4Fe4S-binding SPASM domain